MLLPLLFAQKERFSYEPKLFQSSLRIGFINLSFNTEFRITPKTMASLELGIDVVYLKSHYYNRFNYDYAAYDAYQGSFLNVGQAW